MRDPRRQRPDGFHFFGLDQLRLGGFQLFMGPAQSGFAPGQLRIGFLQALFPLLAFGDVPKDALDADDLAVGIVDRRLHHVHVTLLPPRRNILFDGLEAFAGLDHVPIVALIFLRQDRREKIEVCFADNFYEWLSDDRAKIFVREGKLFVEVFAENILRQVFDQRMVKRLGRDELFFGVMSFDRVTDRAAQQRPGHLCADEVLFGALAHGLECQVFVVGLAYRDDWHVGEAHVQGLKSLQGVFRRAGDG